MQKQSFDSVVCTLWSAKMPIDSINNCVNAHTVKKRKKNLHWIAITSARRTHKQTAKTIESHTQSKKQQSIDGDRA